ncbi:MAG: hypothetical protein PHU05_05070 [Bacilli bacterium]|nr:hypothetical protein [Bacilli bacterium]
MSQDNIDIFNYSVVNQFNNEFYRNIITDDDLKELKFFRFKIEDDDYYEVKGWLVKKDRKKFLVKDEISGVKIEDILPIKITDYKEYSYRNDVYHIPTNEGIVKFKIPAKQTMTIREWFDFFAPFKHTNTEDFELYKGLVLGSLILRYNYRVATQPAFGKNSLLDILKEILPFDVTVYTPDSAPKLRATLEKRLLVIDEIVDIDKEKMKLLEPVIRSAGDMRTFVENSALAVAGFTKSTYDINNLSIAFIYNEYKDYCSTNKKMDKSDKYFDNAFTKATQQRFIPFKLDGELDVSQFKVHDAKSVYEGNKNSIKEWVMMTKWLIEGGFFDELNTKFGYEDYEFPIDSKTGRLKNHFDTIMLFFKAIAKNQKEYKEFGSKLYSKYLNYLNMMDGF